MSTDNPTPPPGPPPATARPAKPNRGWIWYFVVVLVLALGAAGTLVWYNLSQQLTPEKLQAARQLWKEKGPQDYAFRYTSRGGTEREAVNQYAVVVRGGKVESVTLNGQFALPKRQFRDHRMEDLFDLIEDYLDRDEKEKRKVFKVAVFDGKDGHLRRYVRRVTGTRERQEITVEEFRPLGKGPAASVPR
jgi:hypothetical protein